MSWGWKKKFVVFATVLALIEEAITTTMTNLAPLFGVEIGEAYITASTNYVDVVLFHSVKKAKEVVKKLEKINEAFFTGNPKEICHPGKQIVKLSITNETKGYEYLPRIFEVEVVDYAFDHVSRPFLSKVTSTAIGLASMVTYALTLLEQIDTAFGFASGTAAALVAAFIFTQFRSSFQRPSVTTELLR